jgi:hypothetical protein
MAFHVLGAGVVLFSLGTASMPLMKAAAPSQESGRGRKDAAADGGDYLGSGHAPDRATLGAL